MNVFCVCDYHAVVGASSRTKRNVTEVLESLSEKGVSCNTFKLHVYY